MYIHGRRIRAITLSNRSNSVKFAHQKGKITKTAQRSTLTRENNQGHSKPKKFENVWKFDTKLDIVKSFRCDLKNRGGLFSWTAAKFKGDALGAELTLYIRAFCNKNITHCCRKESRRVYDYRQDGISIEQPSVVPERIE